MVYTITVHFAMTIRFSLLASCPVVYKSDGKPEYGPGIFVAKVELKGPLT